MDVYDTGPLSPNSQTVSVYGSLLKTYLFRMSGYSESSEY